MTGVPPQAGSGHSPEGGAASSTASPAKPSVPNAVRILDMVRRMRSDLAQYDYLLPGDYVPDPPLRKHWFRWRPAFVVTNDLLIWAGDIARARSLMDLESVAEAIATGEAL